MVTDLTVAGPTIASIRNGIDALTVQPINGATSRRW